MSSKRFDFRSLPLLSLAATSIILIAVLLPGRSIPTMPESWIGIDKIVHFSLFFLWMVAVHADFGIVDATGASLAILVAFAFSSGTEFLQLFAEARGFEIADIAADLLGSLAGLAARIRCEKIFSRFARRRQT